MELLCLSTVCTVTIVLTSLKSRCYHFYMPPLSAMYTCTSWLQANNSKGCDGGDPTAAYSWILQNGIPDDTCTNYLAKTQKCTTEDICRNCQPEGGCTAVSDHPTVSLCTCTCTWKHWAMLGNSIIEFMIDMCIVHYVRRKEKEKNKRESTWWLATA